jgi:hypothetical protein
MTARNVTRDVFMGYLLMDRAHDTLRIARLVVSTTLLWRSVHGGDEKTTATTRGLLERNLRSS